MDNLSIFLFAIACISTLVGAFYLMASAATSKPVREYNGMRSAGQYPYNRNLHPEMVDVKEGEQLLGVTFEEKPTSCDIEDYNKLQDRINRLKMELSDPWKDEEDDDDDDGDVVALNR